MYHDNRDYIRELNKVFKYKNIYLIYIGLIVYTKLNLVYPKEHVFVLGSTYIIHVI